MYGSEYELFVCEVYGAECEPNLITSIWTYMCFIIVRAVIVLLVIEQRGMSLNMNQGVLI